MSAGWTRRGHWSLAGPQRGWTPWNHMRRYTQARGRWASKIRRLFSIGPYTVYVLRYEPGDAPDGD